MTSNLRLREETWLELQKNVQCVCAFLKNVGHFYFLRFFSWLSVVCWGPGMLMSMIQFIQKECDRQAREIFQHFRENRDFDHKVWWEHPADLCCIIRSSLFTVWRGSSHSSRTRILGILRILKIREFLRNSKRQRLTHHSTAFLQRANWKFCDLVIIIQELIHVGYQQSK